ncbi:hypothetical protein [Massilia sp. DD77]|uniref:hypothetical protein n=1 Tax=Massilia sp. DD77 TaxID=3109349 RepID=UPI002FFD7A83
MSKLEQADLDLVEEALCTGWDVANTLRGQFRTAGGYREIGEAVARIQEGIKAYRRIAGLPHTEKIRRDR